MAVETKSFIEWIIDRQTPTKFEIYKFQLKFWTYEKYDKDGLQYTLKCTLCRKWGDHCKCF